MGADGALWWEGDGGVGLRWSRSEGVSGGCDG